MREEDLFILYNGDNSMHELTVKTAMSMNHLKVILLDLKLLLTCKKTLNQALECLDSNIDWNKLKCEFTVLNVSQPTKEEILLNFIKNRADLQHPVGIHNLRAYYLHNSPLLMQEVWKGDYFPTQSDSHRDQKES